MTKPTTFYGLAALAANPIMARKPRKSSKPRKPKKPNGFAFRVWVVSRAMVVSSLVVSAQTGAIVL